MGRIIAFPVILLIVSVYSLWMDNVPRWLSAIGILASTALLVWAGHEADAFYKMAGLHN